MIAISNAAAISIIVVGLFLSRLGMERGRFVLNRIATILFIFVIAMCKNACSGELYTLIGNSAVGGQIELSYISSNLASTGYIFTSCTIVNASFAISSCGATIYNTSTNGVRAEVSFGYIDPSIPGPFGLGPVPGVTTFNFANASLSTPGTYAAAAGAGTLQVGPVGPVTYKLTPAILPYIDKNGKNYGNGLKFQLTASFYVNGTPISVADAEQISGYSSFEFYQQVMATTDPNPGFAATADPRIKTKLVAPWTDPPSKYGYSGQPGTGASYPYYPTSEDALGYYVSMNDTPNDRNFLCADLIETCGAVNLETELIGVSNGGSSKPVTGPVTGYFKWSSSWTGPLDGDKSSGFGSVNYQEGDSSLSGSGDGYGGISILDSNANIDTLPRADLELMVRDGVIGASAVPSVPEPSTWAMILMGFASFGFAACRRNSRERAQAPVAT